MKKLTATLLILASLILTASCGKVNDFVENSGFIPLHKDAQDQQTTILDDDGNASQDQNVPPVPDDPQDITEEIKTPEEEQVPAIDIPAEESILAEFNTAYEIYKSFHGRSSGLEYDYNDSVKIGGTTYYRTEVLWTEGISTKTDLVNYLETVFSKAIVDDMIYVDNYLNVEKFPMIADTDKGLYTIIGEFAMGDSMEYTGKATFEVIKETDTRFTVRVVAKYYPENWLFDESVPESEIEYTYITTDYPYENIDGEWIFTDFGTYY